MTRYKQNQMLDFARTVIEAVMAANPNPVLDGCDCCGGHAPPTPEQRLAHQQHKRLKSLVEKIEKVMWIEDEEGKKL